MMYFWKKLCVTQFFLLLAFYVFMGLTPAPEIYAPSFNDKLMHFSGYFIAAWSISFAYPQQKTWAKAIFLILFSIGIEIGQHFMPPRTFDFLDIAANSSGVIIGLAVVMGLGRKVQWLHKLLNLSRQ